MPHHEISETSEALPGVENIERSLVNFQDAEIGVAHFCSLDAPGRVGEQRLKGFHKNESDMHAGGVSPWGRSFPSHSKFMLTQIVLMSI